MKTIWRILSTAAIAILLVGGAGLFNRHASAKVSSTIDVTFATCAVPSGTHLTIQSAVNDANCDVITVAPGSYNENVTVSRTVLLLGAQTNQPFASRVAGGPLESTVNGIVTAGSSATFYVDAPDVAINGFTIRNNSNVTGAASGIAVRAGGNNALITYNILDSISTTDTSGNGTAQAIYLTSGGADGVTIERNEMKNIHSNRSAKGVLLNDNGAANPHQNTYIIENYIHAVTSDTRGAYGISVARVANVSGLRIQSNNLDTLVASATGWAHAIGLEGDTPGVVVESNNISNLATASADAIAVWFEDNPSYGTADVHLNNFNLPSSQVGIGVTTACTPGFMTCVGGSPPVKGSLPPSPPVNGTCNWWNSPTGPTSPSNPGGIGASVSANVNYTPWEIAPDGACYGGLPDTDNDGTPDSADSCPTFYNPDQNPAACENKHDCDKYYEQQRKDFDKQQEAAKKALDEQQKQDKKEYFDTHPNPQDRKAFEDAQKAFKKNFDEQQKADKKAFDEQNKANKEQCKTLTKD